MTFNDNADIDTSQVSDRRGGFGGLPGGGLAIGGGGLGIVGVILYLILNGLGGGSTGTTGGAGQDSAVSAQQLSSECHTGADANAHTDCRIAGYTNSVQAFWQRTFAASARKYQQIDTVIFSGQTQTGCGTATAEVGPFYCSADKSVYLDLGFFDELHTKFGAKGGPFAQAYVVAHEYGHHIQDLLGTMAKAQQGAQQGATSASVRLELQADCYAGVWAHSATTTTDDKGQPLFTAITQQDITLGLDAAASVGDDRIQSRAQGRVDPESFTHGTSAQRQKWFTTGYQTGKPASCDTFSGSI